jgi:exocyst complex component 2
MNQASMAISPDSKKKNALTKESEYGVMGIKKPLLEYQRRLKKYGDLPWEDVKKKIV